MLRLLIDLLSLERDLLLVQVILEDYSTLFILIHLTRHSLSYFLRLFILTSIIAR